MHVTYAAITILAVLAYSYAACLNFVGAESVKVVAIGLVVYFICALGAHARVRDRQIGAALSFLVLAVAALIAALDRVR